MRNSLIVIIIAILAVAYASIFIVPQADRGIVLRFGKVVRDADNKPIIYEPGLHF
ncbi:protease modulator HflC, partial [Proteus mirabilis]